MYSKKNRETETDSHAERQRQIVIQRDKQTEP